MISNVAAAACAIRAPAPAAYPRCYPDNEETHMSVTMRALIYEAGLFQASVSWALITGEAPQHQPHTGVTAQTPDFAGRD
jgi:hypothetical protein